MSRPFHLAIPAGDLKLGAFYEKILECKLGNREEGKWIDVDFWGNELTLHKTNMKLPLKDMTWIWGQFQSLILEFI